MAKAKEFRVTIEDKPAALGSCCLALAAQGVNILAFQSFVEQGESLARFVVDNSDAALTVLRNLRANFEQERNVRPPIRRKPRTPCWVKSDGGAKITLWQIGRTGAAVGRDDEYHSSAAMRPAHHSNSIPDHKRLGLQVPKGAIGVIRPFRPSPNPPFAICGHVARTETVGKQHDVAMGCQKLRPRRLARDERAVPEEAAAAMQRHDRREWTRSIGLHQERAQHGGLRASHWTVERGKGHGLFGDSGGRCDQQRAQHRHQGPVRRG